MAANTVDSGIFMALWICKWLADVIVDLNKVYMESDFVVGLWILSEAERYSVGAFQLRSCVLFSYFFCNVHANG